MEQHSLLRHIKLCVCLLGMMFFLMLCLAFTNLPYHCYHQLGTYRNNVTDELSHIVLLGAGGVPGKDALLRIYYTAAAAAVHKKAKIIIAVPAPADTNSSANVALQYVEELILRGIKKKNICFEPKGMNTHYQAKNIASWLDNSSSLLLITSPEHMFRAIKSFRKAGFTTVFGYSTFEQEIQPALLKKKKTGTLPSIENSLSLRYNFWTQLQYEVLVLREYLALLYYWMRGWI